MDAIQNTSIKPIIGPSFQLLSNWCSMGCAGCGIHVAPPEREIMHLDPQALRHVRSNLRQVRDALSSMGFTYAMVEQSGGEPAHCPEVVECLGEVFEDAVHKVITNGLPSKSIYHYLKSRGEQAFAVISVDHQDLALNAVRLGALQRSDPTRAQAIHNTVLGNLDLFVTAGIPTVVSSILSLWNIDHYLEFVGWLESRYPKQIYEGRLTPIPVSLVSFGNANVGKLNPIKEQIDHFEEAISRSSLLTVKRTRDWLLKDLVGHYRNKSRHFESGESLELIQSTSSKPPCEIYRYMVPFNFQDQEILRAPERALFEGFLCGVKALGNIGHLLQDMESTSSLRTFSSNMKPGKRYYHVNQIEEYIRERDTAHRNQRLCQMGEEQGVFSALRQGMCLLDDFDGVWWPLNLYLQNLASEETIGEYWSLFRNKSFLEKMRLVRADFMREVSRSFAMRACAGR